MNIDSIKNGIVIDHIQAKMGLEIYDVLNLGELDCSVAIITNARSEKMGRKDIIKCKNPRCITSCEQELDQIFVLADKDKKKYRCKYCEALSE